MATSDDQLRRQCQHLLQKLKLHQSEIKVMIPSSSNDESVPESKHLQPSTNFFDHKLDFKPEYARDKLRSVVKTTDHQSQDNLDDFSSRHVRHHKYSRDEPLYVPVSRTRSDNVQSHEYESGEVFGQERLANSLAYTTDDNIGERPKYTSRYMTTPKTRQKRELIDRNVKVDSRLGLDGIDTSDRLNFSYSQIGDDDMTFLKSALNQSPEELFQDVADSRFNDDWRSGRLRDHIDDDNGGLEERLHDDRWEDMERRHIQEDLNKESGFPSEPTAALDSEVTYAKQLIDEGNNKKMANFLKETQNKPKSILAATESTLKSRDKSSSKVSFRSAGDNSSVMRRESEKKLLGYDWIAALLDNDREVMDQSEAFFEELKEFRRINRDECSNQVYMEGPLSLTESKEPSPVVKAISDTKVKPYMINDRLFPVPIKKSLLSELDNAEEDRNENSEREPTREEPRFVRVSIPRSTLESPHRFKPHRRRSFDPTDSCGLRENCLLGWENSRPASIPTASNVGISDATAGISSKMATTLADAERLAKSYEWAFPQPMTHYPDLFPSWRKNYQDSVINLSTINATRPPNSSLPGGSESLRQSTTELLNSTYSMMYEMERLKQVRQKEAQTQVKGVA